MANETLRKILDGRQEPKQKEPSANASPFVRDIRKKFTGYRDEEFAEIKRKTPETHEPKQSFLAGVEIDALGKAVKEKIAASSETSDVISPIVVFAGEEKRRWVDPPEILSVTLFEKTVDEPASVVVSFPGDKTEWVKAENETLPYRFDWDSQETEEPERAREFRQKLESTLNAATTASVFEAESSDN